MNEVTTKTLLHVGIVILIAAIACVVIFGLVLLARFIWEWAWPKLPPRKPLVEPPYHTEGAVIVGPDFRVQCESDTQAARIVIELRRLHYAAQRREQ